MSEVIVPGKEKTSNSFGLNRILFIFVQILVGLRIFLNVLGIQTHCSNSDNSFRISGIDIVTCVFFLR